MSPHFLTKMRSEMSLNNSIKLTSFGGAEETKDEECHSFPECLSAAYVLSEGGEGTWVLEDYFPPFSIGREGFVVAK